jgi:hypothetical protein
MPKHTLNPYYAHFGLVQQLSQPQNVCNMTLSVYGHCQTHLEQKEGNLGKKGK